MFGQPGNTSFGGFNSATQSSPFGQSAFGKPIATTSFGTGSTPVFGSNNTSLFSAKPAGTTTGGLFGNTSATPAFGQPATTQSSFGGFGATPTNTNLFGTQQNANTSLFGTNNTTSAFGQANKPAGFGFASTSGTSLFGQPQQNIQQTTPFGQTNTTASTGLFGTQGGFRTGTNTGSAIVGTPVKFNPVVGSDTMVKQGVTQTISTKHHCIMVMKEYENKSLEELRLEDYTAGMKGPSQTAQTPGLFGATAQPSPFGSTGTIASTVSSGFGSMSTGFGTNTQTNSGGSLFGKPTGFGTPATTTSAFAFNPTTSSSLFGVNTQPKPFGTAAPTTLFSNTTTNQPATGFGTMNNTQTPGFGGFGTAQPNQSIGLFNQKPSTFSMTPATSNTGFGGFGQTAPANTTTNLFNKPLTTGFGTGSAFGTTPAPTFGTNTGFGTTQNNNTSLFNSSFKPAGQTNTFSFGATPTATSTLGTNPSLNLGGTNSLFGAPKPGGLFGNTATGTTFNSSGTFGAPGAFGTNTNTNTGLGLNLLGGGVNTNQVQQNSSSVPVHQQILALVSTPFGDSPLLKNLLPASGKSEELIKPANAASKTLNGSQFKVSTSNNSPKVKARVVTPVQLSKKSLFDGLEEEDPTLLEAFQPRPNAKRLVLRPKRRSLSPTPTSAENGNPTQSNELVESNIEASASCSNDIETVDKENQQQSNRQSIDNRRLSSTSWLKTHLPRATKMPEEEFDGQKSPFDSFDIQEEGLDNTVADFRPHGGGNNSPAGKLDSSQMTSRTKRRNNRSAGDSLTFNDSSRGLDESSMSILQPEAEPNQANVTLRRAGYYTIPSLDQLDKYVRGETCVVPNFTVGRTGYGNVYFSDSFDIYGLNLDEIVHFRHKEVIIYPDDEKKPPVGQGLNRKAQVTLDRVWPHDKTQHEPITDPERLVAMDYEGKLRRVSAKHDTRFLEYRPETGSWVFKVEHFSKYGLSDSDDDDDVPANQDMKKLKGVTLVRKSRALNQKELRVASEELKSDKRVVNGFNRQAVETETNVFRMDDDDEDSMSSNEIQQESEGEKQSALSPTSIYARLVGTDSHKLQLMKASFFDENGDDYNEQSMYENSDIPMRRLQNFETRDNDLDNLTYTANLRSNLTIHDMLTIPKESFSHAKETKQKKTHQAKVEKISSMNKFFPSPIVKPTTRVLKYRCEVVPLRKSICNRLKFNTIADISIQMGRKFKATWGPGLTLISLTTQEQASVVPLQNAFSHIETYVSGRLMEDNSSSNVVQRLQILGGNRADRDYISVFKESIEEHLRIQLNHCVIGEENNCRWIRVGGGEAGISALHDHCGLSQEIANNLTTEHLSSYAADIWQLCVALWGNLPALQSDSDKQSHSHVMIRREAFSDWLKNVVEDTVQHELSEINSEDKMMLSLLSANKLEEACEIARKIGDYTLAIFISQLGGFSCVKELAKQAIALWQLTDVVTNMSMARLKIYMLAAGEELINLSSNDDIVNVCENLDWKRALAIHLWYLSEPIASITDVLELYEASFNGDPADVYAAAPLPDYKEEDFEPEVLGNKKTYDLCYHLLKLYCTGNHSLEQILNPLTHTADPFDYRLSWLLQQVIVGLGYSHLSDHVASMTHTNFAAQLEAHDLWHWAIFVVLHLNSTAIRRTAVMDLLARHVQIDEDLDYTQREKFLLEELGIPSKWINEAKAIKGCASKRYGEAAWYLLQAEQWNRAHEVIIEHLAADAIINENYDYLRSLLSPFVPPECNGVVNGWSYQGQLLWDYMEIAVEIESFLKDPDYSNLGYKLELLQPQISSLCAKINQFPCPTAKHRLCQAEIAKRTFNLARSILLLQPNEEKSTSEILVRLITMLPLPEDYAQQELRPIINMCTNEIVGH
ncbi:nuclear pore complex protein Nup98-Nup96 [Microplitis mediator]|uniref:nuclear pore complex protein Nup98-Nup96 n=1 Tax=Microplitis mediator TaxID=375433 RepID=UPI0025552D79|nr:nuclear pore complex protein Nup98-Nup96 [Microplitis mediator]XP_057338405.1 nuclear pore complex protein Nup98-Nup96 [Microplitis mediator]